MEIKFIAGAFVTPQVVDHRYFLCTELSDESDQNMEIRFIARTFVTTDDLRMWTVGGLEMIPMCSAKVTVQLYVFLVESRV